MRYIVLDISTDLPRALLNTTSLSRAALCAAKACAAANLNRNDAGKRVPLKLMRALFEARDWVRRGHIVLIDG